MRSILDLSHKAAKDYFLQPQIYCNIKLPNYFDLSNLIKESQELMKAKKGNTKNIANMLKEKKILDGLL